MFPKINSSLRFVNRFVEKSGCYDNADNAQHWIKTRTIAKAWPNKKGQNVFWDASKLLKIQHKYCRVANRLGYNFKNQPFPQKGTVNKHRISP